MFSRITAIFISLSLFISSFYFIVYAEPESLIELPPTVDVNLTVKNETTAPSVTVISIKDASYGSDPRQTLDLSFPKGTEKKIGLVLYIHGGAWTRGQKESDKNVKCVLKPNEKYATASINYRYAQENLINTYDIIDDITAALNYIKNKTAESSVEIDRVILAGYSAGSHLSLLYAYRYEDISPIKIAGVFAFAPVPDLTVDSFYTNNRLGDEEAICQMITKVVGRDITPQNRNLYQNLLLEFSPISYVDKDTVPTMIFHGEKDTVAPYSGSEKLYKKLSENKVQSTMVSFPNSNHTLSNDPQCLSLTEQIMKEYIEKTFKISGIS